MVHLKTTEEIQIIRESAKILAQAHGEVALMVKPGVTTKSLDQILSINSAVGLPGLMPGINPPFRFKLSAMSLEGTVIAV